MITPPFKKITARDAFHGLVYFDYLYLTGMGQEGSYQGFCSLYVPPQHLKWVMMAGLQYALQRHLELIGLWSLFGFHAALSYPLCSDSMIV